MKGKCGSAVLIAACVLLCAGCRGSGDEETGKGPYIYYVNEKGTSIVRTAWSSYEGDEETEEQVTEAVELLSASVSGTVRSSIPEGVTAEVKEVEEGRVELSFNEAYRNMSKKDEVLMKAAVVQTLVQIEGVSRVGFYIGEKPLENSDGTLAGYMTADDFVQNIGSALNSYQKEDLTLYFANSKGDSLVKETVSVRYNSNTSFEKVIVEQLLKGPKDDDDGCLETLPSDTVLLGISVKAGICYVNFDEGFLAQSYSTVKPEAVIYSLVNSLTESENVRQVQISVNGESDITFRNTINLSKPFSRNMEIVEETK